MEIAGSAFEMKNRDRLREKGYHLSKKDEVWSVANSVISSIGIGSSQLPFNCDYKSQNPGRIGIPSL
jgi:hypothetical protein